MKEVFGHSNLRRALAPAFFFSIILIFCGQSLFAQTYVSNNGIIMERLPDEDVREVERLNEEAEAEDALARKIAAEKKLASEQAQEDDTEDIEEADAIDELFGEESEGDTNDAVITTTTEIVKIDKKDKPVEFSGDLSAELGGLVWFYPWENTKPVATFSNTLKFIGRPRTDFYVYGSFLTSFPEMDFGVYELYFDYTLFGTADISAGKRDISWSLSRMLNTNIIDEKCAIITSEEALKKEKRKTKDSKFTFAITVPVLSYASVKTLAQYESNALEEEMPDYVSLAAKVEGYVGKFTVSVLGKRWAKMDLNRYDPCAGLEIVSTILGKNSNVFAQGLFHFNPSAKNMSRSKFTMGIYKYFENPVMLGLSFEYQAIWGRKELNKKNTDTGVVEGIGQYEGFQHLFAAEIAWSRFIFTKKWTFGCKWFHDTRGEKAAGFYGTITPGIQISEILPHVDFKTTSPIYYGSQVKYGLVFELALNLKY